MASSDINRVNVIGRLTRDPEIRQIPSGTSITTFSIANNRIYVVNNERREEVSYFNCLIWGKAAEALARFAKKGQRIAIDGRLQQRRWQDNEGNNRNTVEIVTDNFQFLSFNQENQGGDGYPMPDSTSDKGDQYSQSEGSSETFLNDDDIPF
ncbi:MAG: single-stranded DNA-binding protein [Spirochaetes bacterium]|jgi:single-strand DNA-binding protein|nr:single-stranded DNA-binding protein [Spirochaetota bacterium]